MFLSTSSAFKWPIDIFTSTSKSIACIGSQSYSEPLSSLIVHFAKIQFEQTHSCKVGCRNFALETGNIRSLDKINLSITADSLEVPVFKLEIIPLHSVRITMSLC